jgi:hypothetical protein
MRRCIGTVRAALALSALWLTASAQWPFDLLGWPVC